MNNSAALQLAKVAEADFPSEFGLFRIYGFEARYGRLDPGMGARDTH